MKKIILLVLASFVFSQSVNANTPDKDGVIKGLVNDAITLIPVEYATIAIYNTQDNSLVNGVITASDGSFKINRLQKGDYYIKISFIGYHEKVVKKILLDNVSRKIDLGNININPKTQDLDEIQVVGNKNSVQYQIDKKIINVGQSHTTASGTAVDVLERVPSVRVDIEGNVSLRGSTGFSVLIDGKPTILEPNDALQQIPASTIENIEIITNPSVKFDPDGVAGIINIITKKNKLQGINGIVNTNIGLDDKYGGDFLINYKKKRMNVFFSANYNKRSYPGQTESETQTIFQDTTNIVKSSGDKSRNFIRQGIRAGLELNLRERDLFTVAVRYGGMEMDGYSYLDYSEEIIPANDLFLSNSTENWKREAIFYSISADYTLNFSKKGHKLYALINKRGRDMNEENENILFAQTNEISEGKKTTEKGPGNMFLAKLDYTYPFSKNNKFEAGYKSRFGISGDETELYDIIATTGQFIILDDYTNKIDYERTIHSLYSLYSGKYAGFGYQFGLRGEYTHRLIVSEAENQDYPIDRWDLFPSLHLSYSFNDDYQIMTSYSRRIERPRRWYLEPFLTYEDAYNVRKGNPALKPEFIDSYEVGFVKNLDDNFISIESYYRITNNKTERVRSVYEDNIMLHTIENIGKDYALGTELMFNYSPVKFWQFDITGDIYNYKVKGTLYNQDFSEESFNWTLGINNTFKFAKTFKLQINNKYNSPSVTAQGTSEGYYYMNLALKKDFFKRKLSANLQVRDVFGTVKREYTSEGPDFYYHAQSFHNAPIVMLTLSYKFNNYRPDNKKRISNDDGEGEDF